MQHRAGSTPEPLRAADAVGPMASLLVLVGLSLMSLGGHAWAASRHPDREPGLISFRHGLFLALAGQVFTVFIIVVAAAEAAIGLGIVIALYRNRETIWVDEIDLMKW